MTDMKTTELKLYGESEMEPLGIGELGVQNLPSIQTLQSLKLFRDENQ
jgi:hypothetical protein